MLGVHLRILLKARQRSIAIPVCLNSFLQMAFCLPSFLELVKLIVLIECIHSLDKSRSCVQGLDDLNLLVVLDARVTERNLTAAARAST